MVLIASKTKIIEPEILFLDLNMPEMDGYEVLMAMKEQGLNILTVVVSGDIQPNAHQRVLELGAIDFYPKNLAHLKR
eukprot:UN20437